MSKLYQIREAAQHVAEAIASVIGVEVTIADEALYRVAGTGCYADKIGNIPLKALLFAQVLKSGTGIIVDNLQQDSACFSCEARQDCVELAQVCCPVKINEVTIGVIALVAFTPKQRQALQAKKQDLFTFLDHMADLLASKIIEQDRLSELEVMKNQLETVLNTVHEGILAINCQGQITNVNTSAQKMLDLEAHQIMEMNISQLFADVSVEQLLKRGNGNASREISCWLLKRQLHCVMKFNTWSDIEGVRGIVATLQEMATVKKIVSRYGVEADSVANQILGSSAAIENVKHAIGIAARTDATVLIRGESGTGKELVARVLHYTSVRRDKPFVAINCAAIPEHLLESELFGYEEGAFTGARRGGKPGKFELANGGTLLLDEIGDMPLQLQAKLLRVLQEKQIERIGGTKPSVIDVRIISATHRDIEGMVEKGQFRQDIYYRINVFPVVIPALRQRREDLPELIRHFLDKYQLAHNKDIIGIDDDAYSILLSYEWPGNVRELENVMEYLVSVELGGTISLQNVLNRIQGGKQPHCDIMTIAHAERQLITAALLQFGMTLEGKEKAAIALGISKATLYRKIKEYAK